MRRRLLLVSYFFPPLAGGGVHRALALVRHLPGHGWDCTVVCAGEEDYWVRDPSLQERVPPRTEVIRVRGGSSAAAGLRAVAGGGRRPAGRLALLRRVAAWLQVPDAYVGWARRAARAVRERARGGDLAAVLSTSPPDSAHAVGRAAARAARVPWVADFRDPWVGLYFRRPPTSWHRRLHAAQERAVLEQADLVTVASRTHARELGSASAARPRRVEHWPNGFEPDADPAAPGVPEDSRFRLVYTGTLSQMPAAETFLEALGELCKRRPEARRTVRAVLAGPHDDNYPDRALGLGLAGVVEFPGPVPHGRSRALQRSGSLLLLWKPEGEGYRTMVPGKLYEYLAAGRPVLALLPEADEAADLVRRAGGTVVPPGGWPGVAEALERGYAEHLAGRRARVAPPPWLAEHERPRLVARMAAWLDELVRSGERPG